MLGHLGFSARKHPSHELPPCQWKCEGTARQAEISWQVAAQPVLCAGLAAFKTLLRGLAKPPSMKVQLPPSSFLNRSATVRLTLASVACSYAPEVLGASATEQGFSESSLSAEGSTENSLKEDKQHISWLQCTHEARDRLPRRAAGRQAQEQVAGSTLTRGQRQCARGEK